MQIAYNNFADFFDNDQQYLVLISANNQQFKI
jgi:hypothetical protein